MEETKTHYYFLVGTHCIFCDCRPISERPGSLHTSQCTIIVLNVCMNLLAYFVGYVGKILFDFLI